MKNEIYRQLQQHLDHMPVPYPPTASGVEIRLLKKLFTREEARVALELSAQPEPLGRIYRRLDRERFSREEVETHLGNMVEKGAILGYHHDRKGEMVYQKLPLAIGMFEFQVDRIDKEMSELFFEYHDEAFADAIAGMKTRQMRTIPVNIKIEPYFLVDQYDNIRSIVKESEGPFAIMNCVCRQARDMTGQTCQTTPLRETCITRGNSARYMMDRGVAREMSREEILRFLTQAKKEGLVLQPENTQQPEFICCCCGCCCAVLDAATNMDKPAEFVHSNYQAFIASDQCEACDECLDRCPMDALHRSNGHMEVDHDRCIGCGVCVPVCKGKALHLVKKKTPVVPPVNKSDMYKRMMMERYGLLGTLTIGGKMALGRKV